MTALSLVFTMVFVLIVAAISMWQRLELERDILIGTIRAALQLLVVGYVLLWVFQTDSWPAILGIVLVMLVVAAQNASRKGGKLPQIRWWTFVAIALAEVVTVGLMLSLKIIPPTAQYVIPVSGMVIGNAMVNASLLLNRMTSEMASRTGEVEVWLSLGATPRHAAGAILRASVKASMIPSVDALKTVGLVQLPGMMTGQILAGTNPVEAVKYQILIMYSLASAAAVCSITLGVFCLPLFFNRNAQLVSQSEKLGELT